jgi:hypothetical protein
MSAKTDATPTATADRPEPLAGRCYYQTPAMRAATPDYSLPGELVPCAPNPPSLPGTAWAAIRLDDGTYVTVLFDGTDRAAPRATEILDQETYVVQDQRAADGRLVLTADRMHVEHPGERRSYWIGVVLV